MGPTNGSQNPDHCGDRVANIKAAIHAERVEYIEQVINIRVQRCVSSKIEVIRVHAARTHQVIQYDLVRGDEIRENAIPGRLVRAEPVG